MLVHNGHPLLSHQLLEIGHNLLRRLLVQRDMRSSTRQMLRHIKRRKKDHKPERHNTRHGRILDTKVAQQSMGLARLGRHHNHHQEAHQTRVEKRAMLDSKAVHQQLNLDLKSGAKQAHRTRGARAQIHLPVERALCQTHLVETNLLRREETIPLREISLLQHLSLPHVALYLRPLYISVTRDKRVEQKQAEQIL